MRDIMLNDEVCLRCFDPLKPSCFIQQIRRQFNFPLSQVNDVFYVDCFDGKAHVRGTLHLTLTHVFFIGSSRKQEIWLNTRLIQSVERLSSTTVGVPLVIRGRNFRVIRLIIPRERDAHEVVTTLKELEAVVDICELPCFHLAPSESQWNRSDGWATLNLRSQFSRFGLPSSTWELSEVNQAFQSALCRSSQPLAGFSSRCLDDELLLEAIRTVNLSDLPLHVVDTRPPLNAFTNRAQGKGYEDVTVYRNIVIQFFEIENIHVVRGSLEKLLKVVQEPAISVEDFISGVDKSGWLRHLRAILEAAFVVATRLNEGSSVLVHCSDGWDRTSQVCSLAQIVLDPYYRTLEGLEALIKKDWLEFGHKFSDRLGLLTISDAREISPIFTQFLDCLRHLCEQCPTKFEYNTEVLSLLHDESHASVYGTFVGCHQKERQSIGLASSTYSVWALIAAHRSQYRNPYYEHASASWSTLASTLWMPRRGSSTSNNESFDDGLVPNGIELTPTGEDGEQHRHAVDMLPSFVLATQLFRLWDGLFLRWEWRLPRPDRAHASVLSDVLCGQQTLVSHRRLLEGRVMQLCQLLGKSPDSLDLQHARKPTAGVDASPSDTHGDCQHSIRSIDQIQAASLSPTNGTSKVHQNGATFTDWISSRRRADSLQLSEPSPGQLAREIECVSTKWNNLARKDMPCGNCGMLLALSDRVAHCHRCGNAICSKCINPKPRTVPGLWSQQLSTFLVCETCSTTPCLTPTKNVSRTVAQTAPGNPVTLTLPHPLFPLENPS